MNGGVESYLDKCIAALPPEKREAARVAFAEIAETGEDSYLSKLLVVLEANNAYAKSIPREMADVTGKFLMDFAAAANRTLAKRIETHGLGESGRPKVFDHEIRAVEQTFLLSNAIHEMREQSRTLGRLNESMKKVPGRLEVMLVGILAGLVTGLVAGGIMGVTSRPGDLKEEYEALRAAKSFLDYASAAGISLRLEKTAGGDTLTVMGRTAQPDVRLRRDAAGRVMGTEIVFNQAPTPAPVPNLWSSNPSGSSRRK